MMVDVSLEARWSVDRLGGGKGSAIGQGLHGITISDACTCKGGGVIRWWQMQIQKGKLDQIVRK